MHIYSFNLHLTREYLPRSLKKKPQTNLIYTVIRKFCNTHKYMYYSNGENNINIKWENAWLDARREKSLEFE